jgi:hypothetical protein
MSSSYDAPAAIDMERFAGHPVVASAGVHSPASERLGGQATPPDLVLCRDALVHFSHADILGALANLRRTCAEYLVVTTFVGNRPNAEIDTGDWRPLNLERSPLSFPAPRALIDERCHHTGGIYSDKRLGLWRFRDLPLSTA